MAELPPHATLLFVDDEPNVLAALKRLFRSSGHTILTAGSGHEALAILERQAVDLVVSDMRMPTMNGAQFLEQVRARWPEVVRILLTGYADMEATIAAINRGEIYRYVTKPWNGDELLLTVRDVLERKRLETENARLGALTREQNEALKALNASLEQKVAERTAQLSQALTSLKQAHQTLKQEFMTSVTVFSGLIELRGGHISESLSGHGRRVARLARHLAQRMGLNEAETQNVVLAGLLHDIGKIGLPDELLARPFNTLSAEARAKVAKHPGIGQNVLMAVDGLKDAALLIRHHHERYDGSGYPDSLAGLAIPLGARILAVANDYDALQTGTLTQKALKADEALAYLVSNRERRYDPLAVDALAAWLAHKPDAIASLPLSTGDLKPGMVLARDLNHRDGYLLLARGHVLDAQLIGRLTWLEDIDQHPLTLHVRSDSIPAETPTQ